MWGKLKARLVADARYWYKLSSVWLAVIFSTVTTIVAANQGMYFALVGYLPRGPFRFLALAVLWVCLIIVPTITRLWKQKPSA